MAQREFLKIIQDCRRRLNMAMFLKRSVFALSIGTGVGIIFQAVAFWLPFYYVNLYTGLALLFAELAALFVMFVKRTTMEQTALVMDSFGFEERIVTAYEHLAEEGRLIAIQRQDAMGQLRAHKDRIRIPLLPDWKRIVLFLGMFVFLFGLAWIPSATKDHAQKLHNVKEEVREKEDEIEEIVEALEQLEQEALTPEQQQALQEMMENLQSSLSEYQQAVSEDMIAAASEKLEYKYEMMSNQMSNLIQSMQNGATASAATMESMQAMAEKLQEMSGQKYAKGDNSGGQNNSNGQNNQGGQNNPNGQNGQGGQNGPSNQNQNGQGGENGQGDGSGQDGQGNGQGDGGDSGNGRGTGSSSTNHDYVSVPNAIAESENLTGNVTNHDTSEYFRAPNGLSWEGAHISYDAVIGSYQQNAYEGIAAGKYPSGMEEIIKEYFASFN